MLKSDDFGLLEILKNFDVIVFLTIAVNQNQK